MSQAQPPLFIPINRNSLMIAATIAIICLPGYGYAIGNNPTTSTAVQSNVQATRIEQALVPEGAYALQLAQALKLGQPQNTSEAVQLLSSMGIEPQNGWIAEYPVTPRVLGELEQKLAASADAGGLARDKSVALESFADLNTSLGLNVSASKGIASTSGAVPNQSTTSTIYKYTDSQGVTHFIDQYQNIPKQYQDQVRTIKITSTSPLPDISSNADMAATTATTYQGSTIQSPTALNDYYSNYGPPAVTYYPPPAPYSYLYSWVSYPFYSTGYYFPGYYVLQNFHRRIPINRQHYVVANGNLGHRFPNNAATAFFGNPQHHGPLAFGARNHFTPPGVTSFPHPAPVYRSVNPPIIGMHKPFYPGAPGVYRHQPNYYSPWRGYSTAPFTGLSRSGGYTGRSSAYGSFHGSWGSGGRGGFFGGSGARGGWHR